MIDSQNTRTLCFKTPGTIATDATSFAALDTWSSTASGAEAPFEYAKIIISSPPASNGSASAKFASLKLMDATSSTGTGSATDIPGATGTTNSTATTNQFVMNAYNDTSNAMVTVFEVDLTTKERYLVIEAQAKALHSTVAYVAELSRGKRAPSTLAETGATSIAYV